MLTRTFLHVQGVGEKIEQDLWSRGVHTWHDFLDRKDHLSLGRASSGLITMHLESSLEALERRDAAYFCQKLPSKQHWRLFRAFEDQIAYLDIETTGGNFPPCYITTIGVYDGQEAVAYVKKTKRDPSGPGATLPGGSCRRELEAFREDMRRFQVLVTYNGKCFDVPWIEAELGVPMPKAHIDLRYVMGGLGIKGGLKSVERQLGIGRRGPLSEVDGWFAVLLWRHYQRSGDTRALETLIRYNLEDVVKLKPLLQMAYNRYLRQTPFADLSECEIDDVLEPDVPIHQAVIDEIRGASSWG